ncbi:hypothetical protein [Jiangella alkaliphila]|uniref:Uncharacterized protein n=1 Tax=Jiangella alkaliphila TaxID=419479 RepID=A0A1H2KXX9_9ACTN|nr:hypothetical protein [Jiangella alkaliphila]SDU73156.1 hypothetical protein SAMN04488563_4481 [Jiangella alkaliphila]
MTGRFDRPGLLGAVTRAAILDGTAQVITNVVTHSTARRPAPAAPGAGAPGAGAPEVDRADRPGQRLVAARPGGD